MLIQSVHMNWGWYIVTSDNSSDVESDPVFFEVYGSNASLPARSSAPESAPAASQLPELGTGVTDWVRIGTPVWIAAPQYDSMIRFTNMSFWSLPRTRNTTIIFDPSRTWQVCTRPRARARAHTHELVY